MRRKTITPLSSNRRMLAMSSSGQISFFMQQQQQQTNTFSLIPSLMLAIYPAVPLKSNLDLNMYHKICPKHENTKHPIKFYTCKFSIDAIIKRRPEDRLWYQIVIKLLSITDFQYSHQEKVHRAKRTFKINCLN